MMVEHSSTPSRRVWGVGALCRAVADSLDVRFNPVAVRGEISGFSRPSSGHFYFTLKDGQGQLRCAMFRRAASLLGFTPRDGDQVEVQGRLDVYDARGDLQLIVESLSRAGQGSLFERFVRIKEKLQQEGLFDPARKRELPAMPRGIGLVTSLGAAALHDVATCLRRRLPHIPVLLAPAAVQGAQAAAELARALELLYRRAAVGEVDVILLVRGGGSLEDLWAFNEEQLARAIVRSPVPLVCGVGHETDFTIADFCADLRAPTPTAAAELLAQPRDAWLETLAVLEQRLRRGAVRQVESAHQRLDAAGARLGRPSSRMAAQQQALAGLQARLRGALAGRLQREQVLLDRMAAARLHGRQTVVAGQSHRLERASIRLQLLDPQLVLQRGYALLTTTEGNVLTRAAAARVGQELRARLADGNLDVSVLPTRLL